MICKTQNDEDYILQVCFKKVQICHNLQILRAPVLSLSLILSFVVIFSCVSFLLFLSCVRARVRARVRAEVRPASLKRGVYFIGLCFSVCQGDH